MAGALPETEKQLTEGAAGMRPHLSDITGGIWEQLLAELGPLRDGGGVGLLQAGMTAHVATLLDVSEYGVPLDTIEGPAAVYEYARRLAQSGRAAAWAWLPLGSRGRVSWARLPSAVEDVDPSVRVCAESMEPGIGGFRRMHRQALCVQELAALASPDCRCTAYARVRRSP